MKNFVLGCVAVLGMASLALVNSPAHAQTVMHAANCSAGANNHSLCATFKTAKNLKGIDSLIQQKPNVIMEHPNRREGFRDDDNECCSEGREGRGFREGREGREGFRDDDDECGFGGRGFREGFRDDDDECGFGGRGFREFPVGDVCGFEGRELRGEDVCGFGGREICELRGDECGFGGRGFREFPVGNVCGFEGREIREIREFPVENVCGFGGSEIREIREFPVGDVCGFGGREFFGGDDICNGFARGVGTLVVADHPVNVTGQLERPIDTTVSGATRAAGAQGN